MRESVKGRILLLFVGVLGLHHYFSKAYHLCNYGISFGVRGLSLWFLIIGWLIVLGMAIKSGFGWGWRLLLVGGVVNLVDRLINGCVIDYWKIPMTGIYNNINDWLIMFGLLLIVRGYLWKKR